MPITIPYDLYDTVGNVSEWTCSEYQEQYNGKEQRCLNPSEANEDSLIVIRGGSWGSSPKRIRSAERDARKAVKSALIERGVSESQIQTRGFGDKKPRLKAYGKAAWAKNRRVEIEVVE